MNGRRRGFTLVELILVLLLVGILSAVGIVFVRPAVEGFVAQRARSELQGAAEAALQVLQRDVRRAVPNSLRTPGGACFELMPSVAGGRYRRDADVTRNGEAVLDTTRAITEFDVLGPLNQSRAPQVGDWVVVGNQAANDAYTDGLNRARITDPAAVVGGGRRRAGRLHRLQRRGPGRRPGHRHPVPPGARDSPRPTRRPVRRPAARCWPRG
jgi:MSHA biogenesis protein MshO